MSKQLIIIGASGHGKVIADIARLNGYDGISFLDDNESLTECGGYPVLGNSRKSAEYNCDFFVAIGNASVRRRIMERLYSEGKNIPILIHPQAVIGEHVIMESGTVVMAGAVINPSASIGKGCIINTCSSVDHDCKIGNYVHISVGAHLAGTVEIEDSTWIGIGTVVSNNLKVTSNCMIGAGAVVVKNIDEAGTYIGVPAKKVNG